MAKKEGISKLSNEILNGTHVILLINATFSLIFSSVYLSKMSEDVKSFIFKENINIIFIPILMNKFYYFTLNYYCIYTFEDSKKFEIISGSSLISIYITIWNLILTLIKSSIPDENENNGYNFFNILYIIQIIFSSLPTFFLVAFIIVEFVFYTGICPFLFHGCDCEECKHYYRLHQFLFCFCSYLLCFGGMWIKVTHYARMEYECCNCEECCGIEDNCCNIYCLDNILYCNCSCCDKNSCCYSEFCYNNCESCAIGGCCMIKDDISDK